MMPDPAKLRDFAARYTAAWCNQNAYKRGCLLLAGRLAQREWRHSRCWA